jgi:hypothetical protein
VPLFSKEEIRQIADTLREIQEKEVRFFDDIFPGLEKNRKDCKNHNWAKGIKKRLKRLGAKK